MKSNSKITDETNDDCSGKNDRNLQQFQFPKSKDLGHLDDTCSGPKEVLFDKSVGNVNGKEDQCCQVVIVGKCCIIDTWFCIMNFSLGVGFGPASY